MGFGALSRADRSYVERKIQSLAADVSEGSSMDQTSMPTTALRPPDTSSKNPIQTFLTTIGKRQSSATKAISIMSIQDELTVYRSLANREFTDIIEGAKMPDPNKFWEVNGQRLKQLNKLARKFLISPATSVPSESAFSCASYIARKQRSRLSPQNLALTMFLRDKLDKSIEQKDSS